MEPTKLTAWNRPEFYQKDLHIDIPNDKMFKTSKGLFKDKHDTYPAPTSLLELFCLQTYLLQFFMGEAKQTSNNSNYISSFAFNCIEICHQHVFHKRS